MLFLLAIIKGSVGFAQISGQHYTLEFVLSKIDAQNPMLASFKNKANAADALVKGAKSWMPPTLSLEYDSTTLGLLQMLPNPKKQNAKKKYLSSLSQLEINDADYLRNQLFALAKKNYYERFISEKRLTVLNENIKLYEMIIEISQMQISFNKSDLSSVYRAQGKLSTLENMRIKEDAMIKESTIALNYLMNEDLSSSFLIDTSITLKGYTMQSLDTSKESIEYRRSDIQKINNSIASMKLNKDLMLAESNPDFGVKFERKNLFSSPHPFMLEVMMTIPILPWVAKEYKSGARSMDFQITAMEQEKESAIKMADQMARMNLIKYVSAYKALENYNNKIIPAFKKNLDVIMLSYQQNTDELFRVLMAVDDLQMSQMDYLNQLQQAFISQNEFEKELQEN